jgi:hypothetical protein
MLGDALRNLKLDRRLASRRGWVKPDELTAELAALPDVSDKKADPPPPTPGTEPEPSTP